MPECFQNSKIFLVLFWKSFNRWPTLTEVQDHITYQLFKSDDWRLLAIVDDKKQITFSYQFVNPDQLLLSYVLNILKR